MASKSLGVLTLDLVAKVGGFTAGMNAAERQASKSLSAIEKRANAFGRAIGVSIKAGAGIAAAALGVYVKNTIEAEKVQAQLAARIRDTGAAAGRTIQQLNEQADKLQAFTVFDDESIAEAQAALLVFKEVQALQFDSAIESALDLATVMGTDAASAAKLLGKALSEPEKAFGALKRAGVVFTESQQDAIKAMVEAGDKAGAQDAILKQLAGTMGTAAEAARNTLGGAFQGLKNAVDNLLEGDAGGGGLLATTEAVNGLTETLNDPAVKSGVDSIVSGLARITAESIEGVSALARFAQNVNDVFDISDKIQSGAGPGAFDDRQLQIRLANVQEQIGKARKGGNNEELKRLLAEREKLVRESTRRIIAENFEGVQVRVLGAADYAKPKPQGGSSTGGSTRSRSGASAGPDEAAKKAEEAIQALRAAAEAQGEWHQQILDMQASLEGPAAEVLREYQKTMENLDGEFAAGKITLADYAVAQDLVSQKRDKDLHVIDAQLTPFEEVNAAILEEIKLLGLSAEQQELYNNLKAAGVHANSEFGESIAANTERLQAAREASDLWAEGQSHLADTVFDLTTNLGDAENIIKDFFDSVAQGITRSIAEDWAGTITDWFKGMFQAQSGAQSGGGGGSGENWGSIIDLFAGAWGFANGGKTQPWSISRVNERGFEMASVGGKDYLMTGPSPVSVTPHERLRGAGLNVTNNFTLAAPTERRTQDQIAQKVGFEMRRAQFRNG